MSCCARLVFCLAFAAFSLSATTIEFDKWYQFSFTFVGVEAQGCFPADASALDCDPSINNNTTFVGEPPWDFTLHSQGAFIITDAFLHGDVFEVADNLVRIGVTPVVPKVGGCGSDPEDCIKDPGSSHATFILEAGPHSITIDPLAVRIEGGSAYFKVIPIPEPATWAMIVAALLCLALVRRLGRLRVAGLLLRGRLGVFACPILLAPALLLAQLPPAPDASAVGGAATAVGSYTDGDLIAAVYRPAALVGRLPLIMVLHGNHGTCGRPYNPRPAGPDPPGLVGVPRIDDEVFVMARMCPAGYTEVPSHEGYAYFAQRLASQGYLVVSINANLINARGNGGPLGDAELILARGELVLTHMQRLSRWDRGVEATPASVGADLTNHIDFGQVGLIGHSRGGEAMRAAYNKYFATGSPWPGNIVTPVTFRAIYEIAPTDFRTLKADGIVWNVLLPMCDADVYNLWGVFPFDRMMRSFFEFPPRQKSNYTVWGANHNHYNTQWMQSDTVKFVTIAGQLVAVRFNCIGPGNPDLFPDGPGSPAQRLTALSSVPALMRGNVGTAADPTLNRNFNTLFSLPPTVVNEASAAVAYPTRVDRGYNPSANSLPLIGFTWVFEDFDRASGTNTYGVPNIDRNVTVDHDTMQAFTERHDPVQRVGRVVWDRTAAGAPADPEQFYFQTNWTDINAPGNDVTSYKTLDFRISRRSDPLNPVGPTDFSIRLVGANGILTRPVLLSSFSDLRGPVGSDYPTTQGLASGLHPILQTVRIPLDRFGNFAFVGPQLRGVRFIFDQTNKGAIFLGNVRLIKTFGSGVPTYPPAAAGVATAAAVEAPSSSPGGALVIVHTGSVVRIQAFSSLAALGGAPGVEIELLSQDGFPVRNQNAILKIGTQVQAGNGRYPGTTKRLVFSLTQSQFGQTYTGDKVTVQYGTVQSNEAWDCGTLDKGKLIK